MAASWRLGPSSEKRLIETEEDELAGKVTEEILVGESTR